MTEYIIKRWSRFGNYLTLFSKGLGEPARKHLLTVIVGLIIWDGAKNVANLNRALFAPTHPSSLWRFIGEAGWDEDQLEQTRLDYLNQHVKTYLAEQCAKGVSVPVFLCIDDTNNPKTGTKTAWASYQYSHSHGGLIRCWCLVTALLVVGPYTIPLTFQLYRKAVDCGAASPKVAYVSKTELACRLVRQWQPPVGTKPFVLVDSWYVCDELMKVCREREFTLIGGLKANRLVKTTCTKKFVGLSEYAPSLPKTAYQFVTLGSQKFELAGVEAEFRNKSKGGSANEDEGKVKVVIGRELAGGRHKGCGIKRYHYRYFVCSDPELSVKTISEMYSIRWELETFHAQAKELLGLDHIQCWKERNVKRLWILQLITYSYLHLEQAEHWQDYGNSGGAKKRLRLSLGQVVQWHKREAHRGQCEWAYELGRNGQPISQMFERIAA